MFRICFILGSHWSLTKSGSEYQAKVLIDNLQHRAYKIFYICAGDKYAEFVIDGVKLYILRRRKFLSRIGRPFFLDSLKIFRILKRIRPDIIYQRVGFAYTGVAAHYARRSNCRLMWHIASEIDVKPLQFRWRECVWIFNYIDKKFLEYGIKNASYIIGQAKYQSDLLKVNYGRECDLIVPNFHPVPENEIRKENPIKVVWIANFKRLKRPELFIRLAEELRNCRGMEFIMIGKQGQGYWQSELESKMDELNNLRYLGEMPIDEVNKILCESHILVNTSMYEGFPNTFIQAWLRKMAVVSLEVDPDGILERENIGFHSRTFDRMVRDVDELVNHREIREEIGERAQKYALENHRVEDNLKRLIELFEG